jgi:hypothetical protein
MLSQIGGWWGKAIDGGPARRVDLVTLAAPGAASRWQNRVVRGSAGRGQPDTRARERGGPEKCRAAATCAHDRAPGERPGGRPDSSSAPGCGPPWGAVHGTPAGRTEESEK